MRELLERVLALPPLEAAGEEERAPGREAEAQPEPVEGREQVDEREGGGEQEDWPLVTLPRREPGARRRRLDAVRAEGMGRALVAEAREEVVDHEAEARVGQFGARWHQGEHRRPAAARQAGRGEGGVDHRPVEVREGVVVDAARAAARAAGAEDLRRRRGGELEAPEGRHRDHRDLLPAAHGRGIDTAPRGERPQGGDPLVLEGEGGAGELVEALVGATGDEGEDRVEHRRILPRAAPWALRKGCYARRGAQERPAPGVPGTR